MHWLFRKLAWSSEKSFLHGGRPAIMKFCSQATKWSIKLYSKLTSSKFQILSRASIERSLRCSSCKSLLWRVLTVPLLLFPAAVTMSPGRAVSASLGVSGESLRWRSCNNSRRLWKTIQWLKPAGKGARGVYKSGASAGQAKFRNLIVLSDWSGQILTRELN